MASDRESAYKTGDHRSDLPSPFIGQIIQRLDNENFEHQYRIKLQMTATPIRMDQSLVQIRTEDLKMESSQKPSFLVDLKL